MILVQVKFKIDVFQSIRANLVNLAHQVLLVLSALLAYPVMMDDLDPQVT